jgi:hypothetical protein
MPTIHVLYFGFFIHMIKPALQKVKHLVRRARTQKRGEVRGGSVSSSLPSPYSASRVKRVSWFIEEILGSSDEYMTSGGSEIDNNEFEGMVQHHASRFELGASGAAPSISQPTTRSAPPTASQPRPTLEHAAHPTDRRIATP